MEVKKNLKRGERATLISTTVSIILATIKMTAGFLTGSVVLFASALDSFSDLVCMFVAWIGFKISGRKPDKKFRYGYYKAESIAMLFVSLFILYAAVNLFVEGYKRIFIFEFIVLPYIGLFAALASVFISFGIYRFLLREGKKINSELLIITSKERMTDVVTTSVVFLTVFLSFMHVPYIEGIVTIIISLLILKVGIFSVKDSIFALMDVSPSKAEEKRAKELIKETTDIKSYEGLKLRKSGPFVFGEVTIKVKETANIDRAHQIADEIEKRIEKEIQNVVSFTVHTEPFKTSKYRIAIPIEDKRGLKSAISKSFEDAKHVIFIDIDSDKIKKTHVKKAPFQDIKKPGLSLVHLIIKEKSDNVITDKIGEIAFHTLRDHLVGIFHTNEKNTGNIVKEYSKGKLVRLSEHEE